MSSGKSDKIFYFKMFEFYIKIILKEMNKKLLKNSMTHCIKLYKNASFVSTQIEGKLKKTYTKYFFYKRI